MESERNKPDRSNRACDKDPVKTKIFAVAGDPVLHSMSPAMLNAAFAERAIDAVYIRLAASRAEEILNCANEMGLAGFNVTSPFKEEIVPLLDDVDDLARRIGAVNTVVLDQGRTKGYNTDAEGVVDALVAAKVRLSGSKAIVIGAGGAAKAAIFGLLSEGAEVTVINRTLEKAQVLAEKTGCMVSRLEDIEKELVNTDILVSCVSSGQRFIEPRLLREGLAVLDANYSTETFLVKDATERGCRVVDGREWLLFQGAGAFRHFTGAEPPLTAMRKVLRERQSLRRRNIAFVGFMATGKSTVARVVSEKADLPLIDIDVEIERKARTSIREIFENKGEEAFRRMERAEIRRIGRAEKAIIACGGGAVLNEKNRASLKKNCIVVWLWADAGSILRRVGGNGDRPLLNERRDESAVKKLLHERLPLYARCSDLVVRSENSEPEEIARKVYEESRKFLDN